MSYLGKFGVKNFKIFSDYQEFDLKPITILTGKNSSGKTSLTSCLRLIQANYASILSGYLGKSMGELLFRNNASGIGNFESVINAFSDEDFFEVVLPFAWFGVSNDLKIKLRFEANDQNNLGDGKLVFLEIYDENSSYFLMDIKEFESWETGNIGYSINYELIIASALDKINKATSALSVYLEIRKQLNLSRTKDLISKLSNGELLAEFDHEIVRLAKRLEKLKEHIHIHFIDVTISSDAIHGIESIDEISYGQGDIIFIVNDKIVDKFKDVDKDRIWDLYDSSNLLYTYNLEKTVLDQYRDVIESIEREARLTTLFTPFSYGIPTSASSSVFDEIKDGAFRDREIDKIVKTINSKTDLNLKYDDLSRNGNYEILTKRIFNRIRNNVDFLRNSLEFHFIPSIRSLSNSIYSRQNTTYLENVMSSFSYNNASSVRVQFLEKWLNKFELCEKVSVRMLGSTGHFEIILIDKNGKESVLSQVGYGYSQILPILVKISFSSDTQYVIEEPETNLHPALQSLLADFLVDAQKTFNLQFIIETHSEYLIRKLQFLIGKKEYKAEDVSLYYFYKPDEIPLGEKQVKKIEISSEGILLDKFGKGFFDEADDLAFKLFQITKGQAN